MSSQDDLIDAQAQSHRDKLAARAMLNELLHSFSSISIKSSDSIELDKIELLFQLIECGTIFWHSIIYLVGYQ